MFETLRKMMFFGLGAAAMSADRLRQGIDDLVERGEMTSEEGRKLFDEVSSRAEEEQRTMGERIRTQVREVMRDLGMTDPTQISTLQNRVMELERLMEARDVELHTLENEVEAFARRLDAMESGTQVMETAQ